MKKCLICKQNYKELNNLQKVCSQKCRLEWNNFKKYKKYSLLTNCKLCNKIFTNNKFQNALYCIDCRKIAHSIRANIFREKHKNRSIVYKKVYENKLKPTICLICGANQNLERHHPDYNEPLNTYDFCSKHHKQIHILERSKAII